MNKRLFLLIFIITPILSVLTSGNNIYASDNTNIFSNDKYSVFVPSSFSVDSESIADYTSFYKDNVTIGISTLNNTKFEDVAKYTETQISDIAKETLDSLKAQNASNIKITKHEIIAFSDNNYPSVHIIYEGNSESGVPVYMEEYIVTTLNYKYTIVLYTDTAESINNDDVIAITSSFTVLDDLITHTEPADTGSVLTILIISGIAVFTVLAAALFIIVKYKKR